MACDLSDELAALAWEQAKSKIVGAAAKKLGKKAALAAASALADSPVPGPGDLVGIVLILWGLVEAGLDIWKLLQEYEALKAMWNTLVQRELARLRETFGDRFTDNECACECLKKYIRDLAAANKALSQAAKMRKRRKASADLSKCLLKCF